MSTTPAIREAIEEGDSHILGIKASALQGRLSFFGLKPVVDAVVQLKLKARRQDISDCWRDLAGIEPWIAAMLQEIGKPNAVREGIVRARLNRLVSPIDRRRRILPSPRNCRPAWGGSGRANRTREERVKTHLAERAVPRRTPLSFAAAPGEVRSARWMRRGPVVQSQSLHRASSAGAGQRRERRSPVSAESVAPPSKLGRDGKGRACKGRAACQSPPNWVPSLCAYRPPVPAELARWNP